MNPYRPIEYSEPERSEDQVEILLTTSFALRLRQILVIDPIKSEKIFASIAEIDPSNEWEAVGFGETESDLFLEKQYLRCPLIYIEQDGNSGGYFSFMGVGCKLELIVLDFGYAFLNLTCTIPGVKPNRAIRQIFESYQSYSASVFYEIRDGLLDIRPDVALCRVIRENLDQFNTFTNQLGQTSVMRPYQVEDVLLHDDYSEFISITGLDSARFAELCEVLPIGSHADVVEIGSRSKVAVGFEGSLITGDDQAACLGIVHTLSRCALVWAIYDDLARQCARLMWSSALVGESRSRPTRLSELEQQAVFLKKFARIIGTNLVPGRVASWERNIRLIDAIWLTYRIDRLHTISLEGLEYASEILAEESELHRRAAERRFGLAVSILTIGTLAGLLFQTTDFIYSETDPGLLSRRVTAMAAYLIVALVVVNTSTQIARRQ